ncbi:MAG: molybdopterin molybdotransferase MoeA [Candidatus Omnitrophica bacterium]|nr:molybdopterin molybdotransferase MoeA [Candidatus Omnitrophota bacterium]
MIRVNEASRLILKHARQLNPETVDLTESFGRLLAEDIYSDSDIPLFDNSAMDGYALKSSDTRGASRANPKILEVVEDIRAGCLPKKKIRDNQAIRIMTGAPLPDGADAVVMVEYTRKLKGIEDLVELYREVRQGENIRRAGEDIKKGTKVIQKGTLLKSSHMGLLASVGKPKVKVSRRPKVAVLATGDEVIDIDERLTKGKLYSSNTYTIYGQILNCGGIPKNLGIAKDRPKELKKKIKNGLDCDLVLTSGGVSVGDYDLVKDVLAEMGTEMKFWKVAMRPGKPLAFGIIRGVPVFGLPGNPVSSMVSFEIFVRPLILKMLGQEKDDRIEVEATLEEAIEKRKGLRYFLRAWTQWHNGAYRTRTTGPQGSGILRSMALANSLIILPEDKGYFKRGAKVTVRFFD